MIIFLLIFVLLLVGASGYLAAIETALTAASPGRMQKLKSEGNMKAIAVLKIFRIKDQVISSLLIANSFINTLSTTIATTVMIGLYGEEKGTILSSSIMAVIIIVFAEVVPKAVALVKADNIILSTTGLINNCMSILRPVNYALNIVIRLFFKVFRIRSGEVMSGTEEVRGMIEHNMEEGKVFKSDRDMLGGVLDMGNITVSEIMVHRSNMITIDADLDLAVITDKALHSSHTRIPLWRGSKDNIVGILHIRDLINALYSNNFDYSKIAISDFISDAWFVPENALVIDQLQAFKKKRSHFALVIDEYGELCGIITLEDILEEIVGQIYDEHDSQSNNIVKISDTQYMIDGSTSIRDVNRELNWNLPYEDANTFAGLIIHEVNKLPKQGEIFKLFNLKITIYKRVAARITMLMVEILDKDAS